MEKEKPYKCEICGKRYKNLNGLKYHKTHSPLCNTEFQMPAGRNPASGVAGMVSSQTVGVHGAALSSDAGII